MAQFESKEHFERRVKQFKRWSPEEDIVLKDLIKQGKLLKEIADILGKSMFAVIMRTRHISGFENLNAKGSMPDNYYDETASLQDVYTERMQKWSDIDNERLKLLYSQGENIYNLAHFFHRSPLGVLMHLQELYISPKELTGLFNHAKQFVGKKRIINPVIQEQEPEAETVEIDWKKYHEEQKELYPNHGKHWEKNDVKLLKLLFVEKDCSLDILSAVFRRSPHAIQMKLEIMGLLENTDTEESKEEWIKELKEKQSRNA